MFSYGSGPYTLHFKVLESDWWMCSAFWFGCPNNPLIRLHDTRNKHCIRLEGPVVGEGKRLPLGSGSTNKQYTLLGVGQDTKNEETGVSDSKVY